MNELQTRRIKKRMASPEFRAFGDAADVIGSKVEAIEASIDRIHDEVCRIVQAADGGSKQVIRRDLEGLHPVIRRTLDDHAGILVGSGFVTDRGFLADTSRWLEWLSVKNGQLTQMHVILDAHDVANYDYLNSDWFDLPKRGAEVAVVGPYVDFGGINDYIVTITKPVRLEGRFLGIVGADLSVDRVEGLLRRLTRNTIGLGAMVLTTDGRLIASSIPGMFPGALLRGVDLNVEDGGTSTQGLHVLHVDGIPWRLVVVSCDDPRACDRDCLACVGLGPPRRRPR